MTTQCRLARRGHEKATSDAAHKAELLLGCPEELRS